MYKFFNSKFKKGLLMCSPLFLFIHTPNYPNIDSLGGEKTEKHDPNTVTEMLNPLSLINFYH